MNHLILFFLCIFSLEVIKKLNFLNLIYESIEISKKVFKVLKSSAISDHWKEKIIPRYAYLLMTYSLKNISVLLIIIISFFIFIFLFEGFGIFLFSFLGITESIIFFVLYSKFKEVFINQ